MAEIAIIGGTGVYDPDILANVHEEQIDRHDKAEHR